MHQCGLRTHQFTVFFFQISEEEQIKMSRRFLNLVLKCNGGLYSVNQLDTSNLFYKSATAAAAARKKNAKKQGSCMELDILELKRLLVSSFIFRPFRSKHYNIIKGSEVFGLLGENKILCGDGMGHTAAFDTRSHSVQVMPMINTPKGPRSMVLPFTRTEAHAASAVACDSDSDTSIESNFFRQINGIHSESLYILDMAPRSLFSFEVLFFSSKGWVWRPLPPPPFLDNPGNRSRWDPSVAYKGNTIFISPSSNIENGIGTYCFNTVTQEWIKAGDWVLPFVGRAEFDPDLGHWFALSHCSPYHFCAISSIDPPKVKHVWSDLDVPDGWSLFDHHLVNLGSGKFCTVKLFIARDVNDEDAIIGVFAVFTGVEVVHCVDQTGQLGFEMLKHKSKYIANLEIQCVL